MVVGIDVGARRLHAVALDGRPEPAGAWLAGAGDLDSLVAELRGARLVAVDAPAQLSTRPHHDDAALSRKFRDARCAEIALGREHGFWVPWVGPALEPESGWIRTGLELFRALEAAGIPAVEVFPHACFRVLAGGARLPSKQTAAGIHARAALLESAGISVRELVLWSHDGLDALVAAVTALDVAAGRGTRVSCGHDVSSIWLPAKRETDYSRAG